MLIDDSNVNPVSQIRPERVYIYSLRVRRTKTISFDTKIPQEVYREDKYN